MDITVLAGGVSTERDVSLITGKGVTEALKKNGHRVILLDVYMGYGVHGEDVSDIFDRADEISSDIHAISDRAPDIESVKALRKDNTGGFFGPNVIDICLVSDIVFLGLHGENGENGKVQATLDLFGIKYTGTGYLASALAMDKRMSRKLFQEEGVPVAAGFGMSADERDDSEPSFGFPCVVKPACGGSSVGVSIVNTQDEYLEALDVAFSYEESVVVEEYVKGREFSIGVVDGEAYPIIEIAPISGFYDYKNKYQAGSAVETCPAELPKDVTEQMQSYALMAADALGLDKYSRMDFILGEDGRIVCLEANTLPGMTPTSLLPQEAAAIGISYEQLCEKLIEVSMR
ncbi:MAG: D-alanine--D-alanine ligase [Eubacterium sp.]|nr:D-alanine--D-alanine ligase [Eubacterium sp.]